MPPLSLTIPAQVAGGTLLLMLLACGGETSGEQAQSQPSGGSTSGTGGSGGAGSGGGGAGPGGASGQGGMAGKSGGGAAGAGGQAAGPGGAGQTGAGQGGAEASGSSGTSGQSGSSGSAGSAGVGAASGAAGSGVAGGSPGGAGGSDAGAGGAGGDSGSAGQPGAGQAGAGQAGAGAASGAAGASGSGGAAGAPVAGWEFKGPVKLPLVGASSARMATHPSEPETVAFSVAHSTSVFDSTAQLSVCTTSDLGQTTHCIEVGDVDTTSPFLIGLGYDRLSDKNLVAAFKGSKSKIFVSTNGGLLFSEQIPFPDFSSTPTNVLWAGATSALMVRTTDRVLASTDLGVTYPTQYWHGDCYPPSPVSAPRGSLAVDAADPTVMLLTCDDGSAKRCVGSSCEVSSLPPGLKIQAVTLSPGDPLKAAALAVDGDKPVLLASSDGGKTFTAAKAPALTGSGAGYLVHDPRPTSAYVYAGLVGSGTLDLLRSFDDGQSWEVITPPPDLAPAPESFFPVEFDVASDGAVLALTKAGDLARLPPPACLADIDCAAESPRCDVSTGKCVACLVNTDCVAGSGGPSCDPVTKQCTKCVDDKGCEGRPEGWHCQESGYCQCVSDTECADSPTGSHCVDLFKVCGCATTADCKGATYTLCDAAEHRCVPPCVTNADCYQNASGPVCDAAGSQLCVECVTDQDCMDGPSGVYGTKCIAGQNRCGCGGPGDCAAFLGACDLPNQICVECLADEDCAGNPQGQLCNEQEKVCAVCVTDIDCKNPAEPYCIVMPGYPQSAFCWATPDPLALRRQEVGAQRSAPQC